ncbi:1,5-anhydro-D-fructose reductase-like [Oppia nitens]|uniref:1,5-anhydro-D-fructose reductase-like n=1 Tax=Oppia nitens TaxID=1686743 RepID=UPI0023DC3DE0|nr:1,5-anhydro-D-fructose reductase-like [Oppia nitens]
MIGLGTFTITDEKLIKSVIKDGLEIGYNHIDTSYFYMNEQYIGQQLRQIFSRPNSPIKRRHIFVTSKLWNTYHSRKKVTEGLMLSLKRLNIKYLDLFLIHFPFGFEEGGEDLPLTPENTSRDSNISVVETWKGMEDVYRKGLVKSIGVSNFNVDQLCRLITQCQIKPVVNQIEINPYLTEEDLVSFCQSRGIQVVAYSPLSKANQTLLNEPILVNISNKYNKTVAQVIMRWLLQRDIVVVPGTTKRSRLVENFNILDFKLTKNEMKSISGLNKNWRKTDFNIASRIIPAAVNTKHTVQYSDYNLPVPYTTRRPHLIQVDSTQTSFLIQFKSISSNLTVTQRHESAKAMNILRSNSMDAPHIVSHIVSKPIIQEIREVITPYRHVFQEVRPVVQEIQTIVNRKEADRPLWPTIQNYRKPLFSKHIDYNISNVLNETQEEWMIDKSLYSDFDKASKISYMDQY